jgi:hypothetical protein
VSGVDILTRATLHLVVSFSWLCGVLGTQAHSVTLIPVEDSTISEKSLGTSLGSEPTLASGRAGPSDGARTNRVLLRFNLAASVPTNAAVTSAALTLTLVQSPSLASNLWFDLRKVLQDWREPAVTWTNRLAPPAPWSAPGGAAPVDFASSITQSNLVQGLGSYTFASSPAMVADVQDWVTNPERNFGWMLICELEDLLRSVRKFGSRESASPPSLALEYTVPTNALTLKLLPPADGVFSFEFQAEADRAHLVETRDQVNSGTWNTLTNIPAAPTPTNVVVSDPLSPGSSRFYRVQQQ